MAEVSSASLEAQDRLPIDPGAALLLGQTPEEALALPGLGDRTIEHIWFLPGLDEHRLMAAGQTKAYGLAELEPVIAEGDALLVADKVLRDPDGMAARG